MKVEPIYARPARRLTDEEKLFLEVSVAGGVHAWRLRGRAQFRTARGIVKLGLAEISGHMFKATPAGAAAVR